MGRIEESDRNAAELMKGVNGCKSGHSERCEHERLLLEECTLLMDEYERRLEEMTEERKKRVVLTGHLAEAQHAMTQQTNDQQPYEARRTV